MKNASDLTAESRSAVNFPHSSGRYQWCIRSRLERSLITAKDNVIDLRIARPLVRYGVCARPA